MGVYVVWPTGSMALLTQIEADSISNTSQQGELYELYRNCSLAVLNCGNLTDNSKELLDHYQSFEINVVRNERGLKIELIDPPQSAIVGGEVIQGLQDHLYAVLRDIVQMKAYRSDLLRFAREQSIPAGTFITNSIFHILRNAHTLRPLRKPNIAVCWGGHSINDREWDYAYQVGHELGLRKIDICTGCGPGIMEAPMRGSVMGHLQQNAGQECRRIGLTEPSIIAAEPPNTMVSELVIMPDIEKRLEAFVRLGHVMIVFPGGPGTAEELLYILGIKLHPGNRRGPIPLILTGNRDSQPYFDALDQFLKLALGPEISRHYKIIIDNPKAVAEEVAKGLSTVFEHRRLVHDSYFFNWLLHIPDMLQQPFEVTHENMAALSLHRSQEQHVLAANLRRAFSGIVTGNVKEHGIRLVREHGPFRLHGDPEIMSAMSGLMEDFIAQGRITLSQREYEPCYVFDCTAPPDQT